MIAWPGASAGTSGIQSTVGVALSYYHRPRQNLAVGVTLSSGPSQVGGGVSGIYSLLPAVRYYPSKSSLATPLNPYAKAGLGPYFGSQVGPGIQTLAVFGAFFGGGLDFRLSGRFFFYVEAGYHALTDFSSPIGGKKNYSGGEVSAGFAFQFGKPVPLSPRR